VTPTVLYGRLLSTYPLPERFVRKVERYTYGPGTMMVHLTLSDRPRWLAGDEISEFGYVHIAPYVSDLAQTYTAAMNGQLPASPMIVAGQLSVVDPTRAPEGQHVLWIQVRALPGRIQGDAAGRIKTTTWDKVKESYADRVIDKLELYAPGIEPLILDRLVFSPQDLERRNPNLHGGDSASGSHHLRQNFSFRPVPGWSTYRTPISRLYMVGAATWPGAGVNATSGYLAAREILHTDRPRSVARGAGTLLGAVPTATLTARSGSPARPTRVGIGSGPWRAKAA
jgi:phytoene dehydrogenase-like protein